jgi:hypothetical protein
MLDKLMLLTKHYQVKSLEPTVANPKSKSLYLRNSKDPPPRHTQLAQYNQD